MPQRPSAALQELVRLHTQKWLAAQTFSRELFPTGVLLLKAAATVGLPFASVKEVDSLLLQAAAGSAAAEPLLPDILTAALRDLASISYHSWSKRSTSSSSPEVSRDVRLQVALGKAAQRLALGSSTSSRRSRSSSAARQLQTMQAVQCVSALVSLQVSSPAILQPLLQAALRGVQADWSKRGERAAAAGMRQRRPAPSSEEKDESVVAK